MKLRTYSSRLAAEFDVSTEMLEQILRFVGYDSGASQEEVSAFSILLLKKTNKSAAALCDFIGKSFWFGRFHSVFANPVDGLKIISMDYNSNKHYSEDYKQIILEEVGGAFQITLAAIILDDLWIPDGRFETILSQIKELGL